MWKAAPHLVACLVSAPSSCSAPPPSRLACSPASTGSLTCRCLLQAVMSRMSQPNPRHIVLHAPSCPCTFSKLRGCVAARAGLRRAVFRVAVSVHRPFDRLLCLLRAASCLACLPDHCRSRCLDRPSGFLLAVRSMFGRVKQTPELWYLSDRSEHHSRRPVCASSPCGSAAGLPEGEEQSCRPTVGRCASSPGGSAPGLPEGGAKLCCPTVALRRSCNCS